MTTQAEPGSLSRQDRGGRFPTLSALATHRAQNELRF
jgi:hypothetical protein